MFAGRSARLRLGNNGEAVLELSVEPWAEVCRILPGQTCVLVTHSPSGDGTWSGTSRADEPFRIDHRSDAVTVWANGNCFHLTDEEGGAIAAADWQCPARNSAS
ncbi:hypothetical protein [Streptomyces chrestomyceticus]|uniref:hypothetical protein n=1 Tax=Streptomyces chrestomyceticus TaxID=68185 RepID=UPI0033F570D3